MPGIINIGVKYRLNKRLFFESEAGGILYASFGISTTNYAKKPLPLFIYPDVEAEVLLGYFSPVLFFSPTFSGFGAGIAVRGNLGTNFNLSTYIKLGGAYLFNKHFAPIFQGGVSYNF